jgi:hypothetical protein
MTQTKFSPEIITAAIRGFEAQKEQIDHQIAELRSMLDGGRSEAVAAAPPETGERKRKKFSAATRRKMAAAQRARYSKLRQGFEPTQAESAEPQKRKLSAAGRRAISEATKKRWAAVKAAKEAEMPGVAKRAGGKRAAA